MFGLNNDLLRVYLATSISGSSHLSHEGATVLLAASFVHPISPAAKPHQFSMKTPPAPP